METAKLAAKARDGKGSRHSKTLRKAGQVPAVVYGHGQDPAHISVSHDELGRLLRHHSRIVDLDTDGAIETALLKEVQYDHLGRDFVHVDFFRVSKDERIVVEVEIELRGTAPGTAQGGVLDVQLHAIEVECLAIDVPESIRINIANLGFGQAIHVKEVTFPESVKPITPGDAVVVQVKAAAKAEAEPGADAEAIQPEIVGRRVKEEGEAAPAKK